MRRLASIVALGALIAGPCAAQATNAGNLPPIASPPTTSVIPCTSTNPITQKLTTYGCLLSQIGSGSLAGGSFQYIAANATLAPLTVNAVNTNSSLALALPPLVGLTQGQWIATLDLYGLASTNHYTVTANGSDQVNGSTPNVVTVAGSQLVRFIVGPNAASWYVEY